MTPRIIKGFRWLALLITICGIVLIGFGAATQPETSTATLPRGFESTQVAELESELNAQSNDADTAVAVVLFTGNVANQMDKLAALIKSDSPIIPNQEMNAALTTVKVEAQSVTENADKIAELRKTLKEDLPEDVSAQVTGPAAIQADLASVFQGADFTLLAVTIAIVAVLLIATYRSPVLWLIPVIVIGIADRVAAVGFTYLLSALDMKWNESTAGILSVLVFGAGTNYALLLISRYRDELTRHEDRFSAMAAAWTPTLRAVSGSAVTVIFGALCLLLSLVPTTQGLGLASALGIITAWIFALFVLPGILVFFDRWIFWPRRPKVGSRVEHKLWDRLGILVRNHPRFITAAALILLAACSFGYTQSSIGLSQAEQFIDTPESITAAAKLEEAFPGQSATPVTIASQDVAATQKVIPDARLLGEVREWTLLQVTYEDIESLRQELPEGDLVGGADAKLLDEAAAAATDRHTIFPLVLGLVFAALLVMLRSFVAPIIMVGSVLLTNLAALGLGWWISTNVFNFDSFAASTPLYAFVFLVALGVDYTIFLITRTQEDAQKFGTRTGVLSALSATGGVITSAGVVLAAVFAALGVLPLVVLTQLGIVVCIGVLLDTLIVRTLLVPAVVQLLGERFWWPKRLQQRSAAEEVTT